MASTRKYPVYKYLLAAIDGFTIVAAYLIVLYVTGQGALLQQPAEIMPEAASLLFFALVGIFTFQFLDLYKINVFVTLVNHTTRVLKGLLLLVVIMALYSFFVHPSLFIDGRIGVTRFALISFALFVIIRIALFRQMFLYLSHHKILQRNALIVGAGDTGRNVAVNLFLYDYVGLRVVGFLDDSVRVGARIFGGAPVVGRISEMEDMVKLLRVDEILICMENIDHYTLMDLMERATRAGVIVKISSPLYDIISARRFIERYGRVPVVGVFQSDFSPLREYTKRVFDIVVSSIVLVLHLPVFAAIALVIKLDSPGPVFFRQVRIGKNGQAFNLYKFRSMVPGSDNDQDRKKKMEQFIKTKRNALSPIKSSTKIVNEDRITRVGKWIRRLSLDELPQLINVLKGEMSLVGPRPCLPYEWAQYEDWHKKRLKVLPGCTGVWQVTSRSVVGFEDMVVLDLHYIQNASLLLDLRMLLKTIPVMLFGTGAK